MITLVTQMGSLTPSQLPQTLNMVDSEELLTTYRQMADIMEEC